MFYLGDFAPGETVHGFYTTTDTDGASITRGTDGTLSVYKNNSDTQTTTGVTSGEDTDSLTGVHRYTIATTDSFYAPGGQFFVILSGAGIDSLTVNAVVGSFTIGKTGVLRRGTAQSATGSTIVLDAAAALGDDIVNGATIVITGGTGIHQSRVITDYVTGTDTATVSPDWTTNPDSTSTFAIFATPPAPTSVAGIPSVNVSHFGGSAGTFASGIPEVKVASIATAAVNAAAIAPDAITDEKVASDVTIASVTGAVGSVTGAVGSVTGNVGGNVTGSVGSIASGGITSASFGAAAITATVIATDAIGSDELAASAVQKILTSAMTEAYAADGATMTVAQAFYFLVAALSEFSVSGTTMTLKKLDGSTTAATLTLSDASDPTSITRAS
jgi:hypothetical protein